MKAANIGELAWGSIGWVDDNGEYFDQSGSTDDGSTLIRVTLFHGRDETEVLDQTQAQGHQLLSKISGTLYRIPARGTRVLVAIPHPFGRQPGGSLIIGTDEPNPNIQFSPTRSKLDLGANVDVMIKGKSVTIGDYNNRFISVGPQNGIVIQDKDGTGIIMNGSAIVIVVPDGGDAKTVIQLTKSQLQMIQKDGSNITLSGGNTQVAANDNVFVQGAGVLLGQAPTIATPALYGVPATPLASASVFISPT